MERIFPVNRELLLKIQFRWKGMDECMSEFDVKNYKSGKGNFWKYAIVIVLCVAIATTVIVLSLNHNDDNPVVDNTTPAGDAGTTTQAGNLATSPTVKIEDDTDIADLYEQVIDSVVTVVNTKKSTNSYFPWGSTTESTSIGSGFIVTEEGHIVTNYHVVEDFSTLTVIMNDGTEYEAQYINGNEDMDVAVIKISANEDLSVAYIGDSLEARTGDTVIAIGCPYSLEYRGTMTRGAISCASRVVTTSSMGTKTEYIQIDAALNPGNSGGPLFNMKGEVIGINSAKIVDSDVENIGFAIPSSVFKSLVEEYVQQETAGSTGVTRLGIGITGIAVEEGSIYNERYGYPVGVHVASLTSGGPAEEAGLRVYDVIVEMDGKTITTFDDIQEILNNHKDGDVVEIVVLRDTVDNRITMNITLKTMEFDS